MVGLVVGLNLPGQLGHFTMGVLFTSLIEADRLKVEAAFSHVLLHFFISLCTLVGYNALDTELWHVGQVGSP